MADAITFLSQDLVMRQLIENNEPIELIPHPDPFERLVISVVNQQLSIASAAAIRKRLFNGFKVTPSGILSANKKDLRSTGLSTQKVDYITNIALAFQDGLSINDLDSMSDVQIIQTLTKIKGIGVWTAKMFLIFVLAREDVFPVEDLAIRRSMQIFYPSLDTIDKMVLKADDWSPYRSYAARYLWTAID